MAVTETAVRSLYQAAFGSDMTPGDAAHLELRSSEERHRALFMTAHYALVIADAASERILEVNPAWLVLYGYDREEAVALTLDATHAAAGAANAASGSAPPPGAVFASDRAHGARRWHRRKDGSSFPVAIAVTTFESGGRRLLGCTVRDITEQSRAEAALLSGEARFKGLAEVAADWYWEQDEHLRFSALASNRLPWLNLDDFRGRTFEQLSGIASVAPRALQALGELMQGREPFRDFDYQMRTRDGITHYLRCSGRPLHDPQGNFAGYRGTGQDITAQRRIKRKAEFIALHDRLTGLPNRAAMSDAANASIRSRRPFALLLIDLDRFKLINQSLGQQIGDQMLREVASRLNCLPGDDAVYCLGGDEFVMLLSSGPLIAAERGIDAVARVVEAIDRPYHVGGLTLSCSCSVGLAIFPDDGATLSEVLKNADVALLEAKKQTGSSFCRYTASLPASAIDLDRLQMENDLLEAFAAQRLQLHYQPRVWLQSGTMAGMEVLLRWTDPRRGAVSPRDFIPLAEQSGLILALGEWVMESACRQAKAWEAYSGQRLLLAVNVSPRQLNRGFPGVVQRVLAETGLTPQSLELDITEDALMVNTAEAIEVMDDITRLGVSLALDDFGTGYSSLTHLKRCPFEALKLAPSFVAGVVERENDRVIVRSVITMAHGLGLRAVAEGVETEAQRQVLQDLGCDEYQGYLKSMPLDAESFAARLLQQVA